MKRVILVILLALVCALVPTSFGCENTSGNTDNPVSENTQTDTSGNTDGETDSGEKIILGKPVTPISNGGNINKN